MLNPDQFKTPPAGTVMQTDPADVGQVIAVQSDGTLGQSVPSNLIPDATISIHGLQSASGKRIELQSFEDCKYQLLATAVATFDPSATSAADWDGAVAGADWTSDAAAHVRLLNQATGVIYTLTTETTCSATGETARHGAMLRVTDSAESPQWVDTAPTGAATLALIPINVLLIDGKATSLADVTPLTASTTVLTVTLDRVGPLADATHIATNFPPGVHTYLCEIGARIAIYETSTPTVAGYIDISVDAVLVTDSFGNVVSITLGVPAPIPTKVPDNPTIAGSTGTMAGSMSNTFTISATQALGIVSSAGATAYVVNVRQVA